MALRALPTGRNGTESVPYSGIENTEFTRHYTRIAKPLARFQPAHRFPGRTVKQGGTRSGAPACGSASAGPPKREFHPIMVGRRSLRDLVPPYDNCPMADLAVLRSALAGLGCGLYNLR